MTNPDLIDITTILDRSGSMALIKEDMEGGFNAFVKAQVEADVNEGKKTTMTLVQFDTEYEVVYQGLPAAEVPELVLKPRGSTALYDAIGRTINTVGARLAALPEDQRPGKVIISVITDGLENSSHEFTADQIKSMIEHQSNTYGWTITYLGANQDAILIGEQMGIKRGHTMTYAPAAAGQTMDMYTASSLAMRGGTFDGFTDEDREKAMGTSRSK